MNIILLRHGRVAAEKPAAAITQSAFRDWVTNYDQAPLDTTSVPSEQLRELAKRTQFIVCSDLSRSIESAKVLQREPNLISPAYRECEMPVTDGSRLKLPVNVWMSAMRGLQFTGIHPNAESISTFRLRSRQSATQLNALAGLHRSVMLIGHGLLNRSLHKQLLKLGWKVENRNASDDNWSYRSYQFSTGVK